MKLSKFLAGTATALTLPIAAQAQQVSVFQDTGVCSSIPLSTYSGWLALAAGVTCPSNSGNDFSDFAKGARSTGLLDFRFLEGPVPFKGFYFSGFGTFDLDLMNGDEVLFSSTFTAWGPNTFIYPPGYYGDVSRIRIRRESGIGTFGLVRHPLAAGGGGGGGGGASSQSSGGGGSSAGGNNPAGPGGNGNSGTNNGNGNGNPGGGGVTNNGNGPGGNNPTNPPYDDNLNTLVNETNAAPEPATILLVASGLGGVGALARRRRKQPSDR